MRIVDRGEGGEEQLQEGETEGQRARRMKTKEELDAALEDVVATNKPGSRPISTFSADVLSQFGGLDVKDAPPAAAAEGEAEEPAEEETLGQRRARLQLAREAAGGDAAAVPTARPALRSTNSMANLLSSNPIRAPISPRARDGQQAQGGLLQVSAKEKARQKEELRRTNLRSSSVGLMGVGDQPQMGRKSVAASGMLGAGRSPIVNAGLFASPTAGVAGGMAMGYGGQQTAGMLPMAGAGMMTPQQQQAMQMQQMQQQQANAQAYYAMMAQQQQQQQMMGMGMPMGMQIPGYPSPSMGYPAAGGMPQQLPPQQQIYGVNNMGMPIGMNGMELPLDPRQRDAIDRWRMGIA